MRVRNLLFLTVAALLFASPALSADWLLYGQAGRIVGGLRTGQYAIYTPVDKTDDSAVLGVIPCENIDILYYNDTDADGTGSTVTAAVRSCPKSQEAVSAGNVDPDACWIIENIVLTGNTPNEAIYGVAANWIYADMGGDDNNEASELIVRCNGSLR